MPDSMASERSVQASVAPRSSSTSPVTHAFGVKLSFGFEAPGLAPIERLDPQGATRVRVGEPRAVEEWRDGRAEPLFGRNFEDGRAILSLHRHPQYGYRLFADGFGIYEISPSLDDLVCGPNPELEPWQWQRFLTAQVLPLLAVLHGREVLHASAVALGDRVIALVGGSGAGKTSVALQLVAREARLVADDVLALELRGDDVIAHPGAGAVNLSPDDRERLNGLIDDRQIAGIDEEGMRVAVERETRPLKLAAVYFIDRPAAAIRVRFESLGHSDRVLGATFNLSILDSERLRTHLDVCAAIAQGCGQYRIRVPASMQAAELAAATAAHAAGVT